MATISDSKRKALISKGAKYYDKGELVDPEFVTGYSTKDGESVVEGELPNGGRIVVKRPAGYEEARATANAEREAAALSDPNSPESMQANLDRVKPLRDRWEKESAKSRSRYEEFIANRGTPVDPFTGGSLVQQERIARKAAETDRGVRGRINRYARSVEKRNPLLAQEFRDEVTREFDTNPNVDARVRRYEGIIRANRQRAAQTAANPLT